MYMIIIQEYMSKDIVLASNNQGKIKEFKEILEPLGFKVLSFNDLDLNVDIEETGTTFEENALIKARYLKDKYPIVIADDSGIEIFALDNKPGIYSARFLGKDLDYRIKNQMVIDMLKDKDDRGAKFVSVIAYIENGTEMTFRGEVVGSIVSEICGGKGFGYDPIFSPNGFSQTFGQLADKEKNKISHRAVALLKFKEWLVNEKIQ